MSIYIFREVVDIVCNFSPMYYPDRFLRMLEIRANVGN